MAGIGEFMAKLFTGTYVADDNLKLYLEEVEKARREIERFARLAQPLPPSPVQDNNVYKPQASKFMMSLEDAIQLRNELILSGVWVAPVHEANEVLPRRYATVTWDIATQEVRLPDITYKSATAIVDGLAYFRTQDSLVPFATSRFDKVTMSAGDLTLKSPYIRLGVSLGD